MNRDLWAEDCEIDCENIIKIRLTIAISPFVFLCTHDFQDTHIGKSINKHSHNICSFLGKGNVILPCLIDCTCTAFAVEYKYIKQMFGMLFFHFILI